MKFYFSFTGIVIVEAETQQDAEFKFISLSDSELASNVEESHVIEFAEQD